MGKSNKKRKLKNQLLVWLGEIIGPLLLRFFYSTNDWKIEGSHHYKNAIKKGQSVIIASWHSTLLTVFMSLSYKNFYGLAGNHYPEAEIISRIGAKLGWRVVRGSSTNGGKEAYEKMLTILKQPGNVFAITPDGPQGPAKKPKAGAIRAAQKTGAVIVPAAGQSTKRWSFHNWDTFYLSKPYGKIVQIYGEPIMLKPSESFSDCEERLRLALDKLEKEVESRVGLKKDN